MKNYYSLFLSKSEVLFPKFCSFILITTDFCKFLCLHYDLGGIWEFESCSFQEIINRYFYTRIYRIIEYLLGKENAIQI